MQTKPLPIARYLMCVFYDAMLLFTLLFIATVLLLPLNNGEAVPSYGLWAWGYKLYLFLIGFVYFAYPWKRTGQTLGMKVWKFKLIAKDDEITYPKLFMRYAIATLAWLSIIGILWRLIPPHKQTWQDWLSPTQLIDTK